jgi:hypothetical protein
MDGPFKKNVHHTVKMSMYNLCSVHCTLPCWTERAPHTGPQETDLGHLCEYSHSLTDLRMTNAEGHKKNIINSLILTRYT